MKKVIKSKKIDRFNLSPGSVLAGKYVVIEKLGCGWEGEVYLVKEKAANIERTAKLFFPQRNLRDKTSKFYANKLHKLRHCPVTGWRTTSMSRKSPIWFVPAPCRRPRIS